MKTIKQVVKFSTSPVEVYEALGEKALISPKVGGKFSAYSGYIEGRNLKLEPGKLIVQEWRGTDWPDGVYSRATFKIKKTKTGSELVFTQSGVPDEQYKSISQGWVDYYWKPMEEMFKS